MKNADALGWADHAIAARTNRWSTKMAGAGRTARAAAVLAEAPKSKKATRKKVKLAGKAARV